MLQSGERPDQRRPNLVDWHARCAGELAELVPIGMRDDRDVHVVGGRVTQQPLQPDLACRGVHDVDTPDDFGYTLHGIVYDDGELVGDEAVATADDEVPGLAFEMLNLLALQSIGKGNRLVGGAQPNGGFRVIASAAAGSRVDGPKRPARCVGQVFAGATAGIGQAAR